MLSAVIKSDDDDAARAFEYECWIVAALIAQIIHLAGTPAIQPFRQAPQFFERFGWSNATKIKANAASLLKDPRCSFSRVHAIIMHESAKPSARNRETSYRWRPAGPYD